MLLLLYLALLTSLFSSKPSFALNTADSRCAELARKLGHTAPFSPSRSSVGLNVPFFKPGAQENFERITEKARGFWPKLDPVRRSLWIAQALEVAVYSGKDNLVSFQTLDGKKYVGRLKKAYPDISRSPITAYDVEVVEPNPPFAKLAELKTDQIDIQGMQMLHSPWTLPEEVKKQTTEEVFKRAGIKYLKHSMPFQLLEGALESGNLKILAEGDPALKGQRTLGKPLIFLSPSTDDTWYGDSPNRAILHFSTKLFERADFFINQTNTYGELGHHSVPGYDTNDLKRLGYLYEKQLTVLGEIVFTDPISLSYLEGIEVEKSNIPTLLTWLQKHHPTPPPGKRWLDLIVEKK